MLRPEFLHCPMTPEIIRHIREEQERYDQNPDEYERMERDMHEKHQLMEIEELEEFRMEQLRLEAEEQAKQDYYEQENELPF